MESQQNENLNNHEQDSKHCFFTLYKTVAIDGNLKHRSTFSTTLYHSINSFSLYEMHNDLKLLRNFGIGLNTSTEKKCVSTKSY